MKRKRDGRFGLRVSLFPSELVESRIKEPDVFFLKVNVSWEVELEK